MKFMSLHKSYMVKFWYTLVKWGRYSSINGNIWRKREDRTASNKPNVIAFVFIHGHRDNRTSRTWGRNSSLLPITLMCRGPIATINPSDAGTEYEATYLQNENVGKNIQLQMCSFSIVMKIVCMIRRNFETALSKICMKKILGNSTGAIRFDSTINSMNAPSASGVLDLNTRLSPLCIYTKKKLLSWKFQLSSQCNTTDISNCINVSKSF